MRAESFHPASGRVDLSTEIHRDALSAGIHHERSGIARLSRPSQENESWEAGMVYVAEPDLCHLGFYRLSGTHPCELHIGPLGDVTYALKRRFHLQLDTWWRLDEGCVDGGGRQIENAPFTQVGLDRVSWTKVFYNVLRGQKAERL